MTTTPEPPTADLPAPVPDPEPLEAVAVPDDPTPRPYLELRPSTSPLNPRAVEQAMARLHTVLAGATPSGWTARLARNTTPPAVEWLLASTGGPDPLLRCLAGATDDALIPDLKGVLRTLVPNTYELRTVDWHPQALERQLGHDTADPPATAAVEYRGQTARRHDYLCPITPYADLREDDPDTDRRRPLSILLETMTEAAVPVVYQVLCRPYGDVSAQSLRYRASLQTPNAFDSFLRGPRSLEDYRPGDDVMAKVEAIESRDPARTFHVSARAIALTDDRPAVAADTVRQLATVFGPLANDHHELAATVHADGRRAGALRRALYDRTLAPVTYPAQRNRLRRRITSPGIVLGPAELPGLCAVDGATLPPNARRAITARPAERTGLPPPTPDQLDAAGPPGQALGVPLSADRQPLERPYTLSPALQAYHTLVVGATGTGKTVLQLLMALTNHRATAGPEIIIDLKGGGTSREYLQAHYATYGDLDDVVYFDCQRYLPALSILDLGPLLEADIPRVEASARLTGHYIEMLATLMGPERFWGAVESPTVIRTHLLALFDPVNGRDHVTNDDLFDALRRTRRDGATPPTADDQLTDTLTSRLEGDRDVFTRVLGGALNRVNTIATDPRVRPLFDHRPGPDDPRFDFADVINRRKVVVFDFGGMEDAAKATITIALFATLWRALHARAAAAGPDGDPPLVNLYLEEAGAIGDSALLDTLLREGRGFGLGVTLGVQFLAQLDSPDPDSRTDEEALNETATIVAGQTADTHDLGRVFASEALSTEAVAQRLARMPRGEWLVRPAAGFGSESIAPFLLRSLPAPAGHPASEKPLTGADREAFEAALDACAERTRTAHGLVHASPTDTDGVTDPVVDTGAPEPATAPAPTPTGLHTAYPLTKRLPPTVYINDTTGLPHCAACDNRYDASADGLRRAVACHGSLAAIHHHDFPLGGLHPKLTPAEREACDLTLAQHLFMQAVYNIQQGRYERLEFDIVHDSMVHVREYVPISDAELQDLITRNLLSRDLTYPHLLYSVTPAGRNRIGEAYRAGVDFGDGKGDLEESSPHVMGVEIGERLLAQRHVAAADSRATAVRRFYELDDGHRIDLVAVDDADDVVVTIEVERINNDAREAIPEDYDKMAACAPEAAIWLVPNREAGHAVLGALNDPLDGEPRVEKTYSPNTPLDQVRLDAPGCTAIMTFVTARDRLALDDRPTGPEPEADADE